MRKFIRIIVLLQLAIFVSCTDEGIGDLEINEDVVDEELFELIGRMASTGNNSIECIKFNLSVCHFILAPLQYQTDLKDREESESKIKINRNEV